MEMTLLSITVCFTHFLIASALYFNTLPTNTMSAYSETTQITPATTKTNQEPKRLINATSFSPLTTTTKDRTTHLPSEVHTQPKTTPNVTPTQETTSLPQYTSSTPSQNGMMDDSIGVSNASNVAMSQSHTSHTTVSTNFPRLSPQNNETGTMSSASYTDDGRTVQTANTLSELLSVSTVPWKDWKEKEDNRTKADEGNDETNSTQATFANTNEESRGTQSTEGSYSFTSEHREEPYDTTANTIGASSATATARNDWSTSQSTGIPTITEAYTTAQDPTVTDAPEYHTSTGGVNPSTTQQNRFTNSTAHTGRENFTGTANTIGASSATATARNDWSTSQSTGIPTITAAYTTAQDPTVTDAPEYHTSTDGVNHSTTTQQNRFTNSTAHTGRENITGTDTPGGTTTYNDNSIITNVLTDATTNKTNTTDTESKVWPTCLNPNPESHPRQFPLVCFITVWALAMTATIFLGITIFLWVRLSVFKKKKQRREKGGQTCEKESLWADPKASVQERVEFWYVSGSTMEADKKQKDRKRQERMKKRAREQENEENGLWIQPRVTVDDITDFWYANGRMKDERVQDT